MKILIVCENYLPHLGGAEVVFKNLAERFVERGHEVNLVTHRMRGTKKFEIMGGVRIHRVRSGYSRYLFSLTSIPRVLSLAKNSDIVQTTTFNGAPPAWLGAKVYKKKAVLTVHEMWIGKWGVVTSLSNISCGIHDLLERLIYKLRFDRYVCVSDATKRDVLKRGIPINKVQRIYNGFNHDQWGEHKFSGKSVRERLNLQKKFVYFSWGRPGPSKGFEYSLLSVPIISKMIPLSHYLLMLGSREKYPREYERLRRIIKDLKIEREVTILPSVPYSNLGNYIATADCVVIPSLSEGFGYAALEAAEMGVPIVASNTASLPEVISGRYVLTKAGDPNSIAEGVLAVWQKKYSQAPLKRFLWDKTVDEYLGVYEELIDDN